MSNHVTPHVIKKSVTNMGIKIYNNLPSEIKTTQNFKAFKHKLKDYLLLNAFYSLKEFFELINICYCVNCVYHHYCMNCNVLQSYLCLYYYLFILYFI
jgi:hypothetical protein